MWQWMILYNLLPQKAEVGLFDPLYLILMKIHLFLVFYCFLPKLIKWAFEILD